jgi:hypothetical protein
MTPERIHYTGPDALAVLTRVRASGLRARLATVAPGVLAVLVTPGPDTLAAILADTTAAPAVFVPCAMGAP